MNNYLEIKLDACKKRNIMQWFSGLPVKIFGKTKGATVSWPLFLVFIFQKSVQMAVGLGQRTPDVVCLWARRFLSFLSIGLSSLEACPAQT
jgi:hypothetical protein